MDRATRRRPSRAVKAGVAAAALATSLAVVPSAAAAAVAPTGTYCVHNADTGATACVESLADYDSALAAAGIQPSRGDGTARSALAPAATQYLLGRFFDNAGYDTSDGFIDWFAGNSCTATTTDINSAWSDTTTWRNRISSFQGYSGCRIKAYENTSYGGASLGYVTSSSNVGVLNDHIWSVRFS